MNLLLFILGALLIAAIVVIILIRLVRRRVANTLHDSAYLVQMMDQVMDMGDYFVVEWDLKNNMLRNKYGNMMPQSEMRPEDFLKLMPPEEAKQLHDLNTQLVTGVISHFDMRLSFNQGTKEQPVWKTFYGNAIIETEKGKPRCVLYTTKDITEEVKEEQRVKDNAKKYKKMFDTNLVSMSFYDVEGHLLDLNQKMREFCEIDNGNMPFFRATNLFSFPNLKGIYLPGTQEVLHVCQHVKEPELGLDKYVEFRIRPVINDEDELVYYIVTNRDITAERNMYLEQRNHDRKLQAVNEKVRRYEQLLGYLLEESKMYIWNYVLAENIVNLTRTPRQSEFSETIEEYLLSVSPEARQEATAEMQRAMQEGKPYNTILPFDHTPLDNKPTWYAVSGVPIFKDGKLTEYFGLSRNITDLMKAQEKLRVETARAKDSGRLKAAFLANMTHEIRTPLNAIVGFSDLLPMIDDANEKKEMIQIIRNNCDMLLRLINDILEASNIERQRTGDDAAGTSQPLDIEPADIDFAQAFDEICQTLEQRVQTPGVEFIKENPYSTFPTRLDKGRMQQVITNFVTNAVKYTRQGHIKVGWRPQDDGLYIYCEDTGAGIPKEQQPHVFERFVKLNEFVQGTGLGLNICKSIAERCGGKIGVESNGEGHGSTFWIWVPCQQPAS